jgi:hypothetical protein
LLDALVDDALASLAMPGLRINEAAATVPAKPGLYAVHGSASTWRDLGLEQREPGIPLYVGKAQKSLASRDVRVHFGIGASGRSTTGQSTLRRSLSALLVDKVQLNPVPRGSMEKGNADKFALDPLSDARLTEWMHEHLRLATWVIPSNAGVTLANIEKAVIRHRVPPLNITSSPSPSRELKAARARMALRAQGSVGAGSMEPG